MRLPFVDPLYTALSLLQLLPCCRMSCSFRSFLRLSLGAVARVAPVPALTHTGAGAPRAMVLERSLDTTQAERRLSSASPGPSSPDAEAQAQVRVQSFLALFRDFEETGVPSSAGAVPVRSGRAAAVPVKGGSTTRAAEGGGTFDLQRMQDLMHALGRPLDGYQVVHVAGTKGKGTTASFLASILRTAGLRTGLYTRYSSPGSGPQCCHESVARGPSAFAELSEC